MMIHPESLHKLERQTHARHDAAERTTSNRAGRLCSEARVVELPALPTGDGPCSAVVAFCRGVVHPFAASTGRDSGPGIGGDDGDGHAFDGRRADGRQFVGAVAVGAR